MDSNQDYLEQMKQKDEEMQRGLDSMTSLYLKSVGTLLDIGRKTTEELAVINHYKAELRGQLQTLIETAITVGKAKQSTIYIEKVRETLAN